MIAHIPWIQFEDVKFDPDESDDRCIGCSNRLPYINMTKVNPNTYESVVLRILDGLLSKI